MPLVPFDSLSDASRVWVFGAEPALDAARADALLQVVDGFLAEWTAHGVPLRSGRDWRDDRFLVAAVDESATHASGCSIDGLYRQLAAFEKRHSVSLLSRDFVFYRGRDGEVRSVSRDEFTRLAADGTIGADTTVFDTSVNTLGEWRERFELSAAGSWHRALLTV